MGIEKETRDRMDFKKPEKNEGPEETFTALDEQEENRKVFSNTPNLPGVST